MWRDAPPIWALVVFAVLIVLVGAAWLLSRGVSSPVETKSSDLKDDEEQRLLVLDQEKQTGTKIVDYRVRVFQLAKIGNSLFECEDAFAISDDKKRLAVSDGVSQSFASRLWAQILVKHLVDSGTPLTLEAVVAETAKRWQSEVDSQLNSNTSWNVRKKLEDGAQATFANLVFESTDDCLLWEAELLRDCVVAQLSGLTDLSHGVIFHPSNYLDLLNSNPDTVSSRPPYIRGTPKSCSGEIPIGAQLLVMTDALAIYMSKMFTEGTSILDIFPFLSEEIQDPYAEFEQWANSLRPDELEDDDLTLVEVFYR